MDNDRLSRIAIVMIGVSGALLTPRTGGALQDAVLRGVAIDSVRRTPIAFVRVTDLANHRSLLSDSVGRFIIEAPDGAVRLLLQSLGYEDAQVQVDVVPDYPVVLPMAPDPVELRGLAVLRDGVATRRRGPRGQGEILYQADLMNVPDGKAYDLLMRMIPMVRTCHDYTEELCMGISRGMGLRRVSVCVDGHQVTGPGFGIELAGVDPRDLFMVEVYGSVGEVRMYSAGFVRRMLQSETPLRPVSFGCEDQRSPGQ